MKCEYHIQHAGLLCAETNILRNFVTLVGGTGYSRWKSRPGEQQAWTLEDTLSSTATFGILHESLAFLT